MKGNQNLPNRQVTSNNMTGRPLPFPYRSRSNSRDRNNSRQRSPHKYTQNNSKPYYGNSNFKPPSRIGSPYPKPNFYKKTSNSRPQSPYNNKDGNRPDDHSHEIALEMSETILTHYWTKIQRTAQRPTQKILITKAFLKKLYWNNNSMIYSLN